MILAFAVAVHLPITYSWIALIAGIVVFVLRAILEVCLKKQGLPLAEPLESAPVAESASTSDGSIQVEAQSQTTCRSIITAPFAIPLLVFTLTVFITGFCKGGVSEGFASVVTLRTFLVYFVAYRAFSKSETLLRKTLLVLLSVGAVVGVYGSYQQVFNFHPGGYPYLQATGFVDHPMAFAGLMETTACLSIGLLLAGGWPFVLKNKAAFVVITVCNLAGVYFASQRSAWLGMVISILAMSLMVSTRTFIRVVAGLAVVGVLSWFFVPVVKTRIMPMITNMQSDVGVTARFVIWEKSLDIWKEHPVVGVGPRDFPKIDIPEAIIPGESTHLVHAHNNILQMMATMGTLGLLAYLYLELTTLFVAFRAWISKTDGVFSRAIGLGVVGGIVSLMVAGLFEYNFGTGHVRLMHWFALAMLIARPNSAASADEPDRVIS